MPEVANPMFTQDDIDRKIDTELPPNILGSVNVPHLQELLHEINAAIFTTGGTVGPPGPQGPQGDPGLTGPPGPTAVSADPGNIAKLGSDNLIFVPDTGTQVSCVINDFSVTNNTALADIVDLSLNLQAGHVYSFTAELFVTNSPQGGTKAAVNGSVGVDVVIYDGWIFDTGQAQIKSYNQFNALGGVVYTSGGTTGTTGHITFKGTIKVNTSGTLSIQFAQNQSNNTASVVKAGSYFVVTRLT